MSETERFKVLRAQINDIEAAAKEGPQSIYSARIQQLCEDARAEVLGIVAALSKHRDHPPAVASGKKT